MRRILALSTALLIAGAGAAVAAGETMSSIPSSSVTVTDWYKQNVYDLQNNKIGSVDDVLVSPEGKVNAVILSANGKDIAVKFSDIKKMTKNNEIHLTMNTSKDALKSAPAFRYDKMTTTWVPDTSKTQSR